MLDAELRKGRTLQQLIDSGDVDHIAAGANGMTGWAPGKAFGSMGELLLFAPRFLQNRIDTVVRDSAGTGRGLANVATGGAVRGVSIEQRVARRSLLKMIGTGVVLTVAANRLLGVETDWDLLKDGKPNPNFLRIRAFERDWSMFGTWGGLLRATIYAARRSRTRRCAAWAVARSSSAGTC